MELLYTDFMGPVTPAANGGYLYVAKFTDYYTRMKNIFLLKSKAEAVESLHLYNQTVVVPLGLCIQRPRADKGGQYIFDGFRKLCVDSGIHVEYTATVTPQHNGVPEKKRRTIATITMCLLKDGNPPASLWGEMFFTAIYLRNRSPHYTLDGAILHDVQQGSGHGRSTCNRGQGVRAYRDAYDQYGRQGVGR